VWFGVGRPLTSVAEKVRSDLQRGRLGDSRLGACSRVTTTPMVALSPRSRRANRARSASRQPLRRRRCRDRTGSHLATALQMADDRAQRAVACAGASQRLTGSSRPAFQELLISARASGTGGVASIIGLEVAGTTARPTAPSPGTPHRQRDDQGRASRQPTKRAPPSRDTRRSGASRNPIAVWPSVRRPCLARARC